MITDIRISLQQISKTLWSTYPDDYDFIQQKYHNHHKKLNIS